MEALLLRYGYLLIFLGVALEGEVVLLAAAALCHSGYFRLAIVMGVAVAANWTADQVYYLLARSYGYDWLEKRFGTHPRYERALGLMGRYGNALLLFSRYAFGFRIIIPAACGALGMPPLRFGLLNLLAGLIWVVPTASLGYSFGAVSTHLFVRVSQYRIWVTAVLVLLAIMLWLAADRQKKVEADKCPMGQRASAGSLPRRLDGGYQPHLGTLAAFGSDLPPSEELAAIRNLTAEPSRSLMRRTRPAPSCETLVAATTAGLGRVNPRAFGFDVVAPHARNGLAPFTICRDLVDLPDSLPGPLFSRQ